MSVHHVSLLHTRIFAHCFDNSDNCFFICRSCGTAGAGERDLVRGYRLAYNAETMTTVSHHHFCQQEGRRSLSQVQVKGFETS